MPTFSWKHRSDKVEVKRVLQLELHNRGYSEYVIWDEDAFRVSAGLFGVLLKASGEITDEQIIVAGLSGLLASRAQSEVEAMLGRLFPNE